MTTIAELGLAVNSESAVQAADNLDGMVEAGARAEQAINKVAETSEQAKSRLLALGKAALESSTYQETLNRAYEATAGASAAAAREQLNQSAALRQSAKAASESSAAQEQVVASEKKATAAIAEQRTQLEQLLAKIDPTTAALARLGDQQRQLEKFKAAGIIDPATFAEYKTKLQQTESALANFGTGLNRTGVSAKQTEAALRQLPAQFTDIFTSLAGGQNPLLVLIQQGGQIKDSFGGIGLMFDVLTQKVGSFLGLSGGVVAAGAALGEVGLGARSVGEGAEAAGEGLGSLAEGANTTTDALKNTKEAADALRAATPPLGIGLGAVLGVVAAVAAAVVALGIAYKQGSDETSAYGAALALTGNTAGATAGQLSVMARAVAESNGTVHEAAASLAQLARSTRIPLEAFEGLATAAANFEDATGVAATETIANFERIAKEPSKALLALNESMNFLTASTLEQIQALERQGKTAEAASLSNTTYSEALTAVAGSVNANLGSIESGWKSVKEAAASAWDVMRNVGREKSFADAVSEIEQKISDFREQGERLGGSWGKSLADKGIAKQQSALTQLLVAEDERLRRASAKGVAAQIRSDGIEGEQAIRKVREATQTNAQKREKEIEDYRLGVEKLRKSNPSSALLAEKQIAQDIANIRAKYKDSKVSGPAVDLTSFNDAENKLKALNASYQNSLRILDASQKAGLISSQQYAEQKSALISKEKTEVEAAYNGQITALESVRDKSTTTGAQRIQIDQKIADARSKMVDALKKLDADQEVLSLQSQERMAKETAAIEAYGQALDDNLKRTQDSLDLQLAGFGLGERTRQQFQEMLKIRQDYEKDLEKLERDHRLKRISDNEYAGEKKKLEKWLAQRLQLQEQYYKEEDALRGDWQNGVSRAYNSYIEETKDIAGQTENLFSNALGGIEDAFVNLATTGKLSFKSLSDSIVADLARIATKAYITVPLLSALGLGGSTPGGGSGVSSMLGGGGSGSGLGDLFSWGSKAYNVATSGFGSAVSAGWSAGEGFLGGMQSAISGGYNYISSGLSGLFGGGAASSLAGGAGSNVGYGLGQSLVSGNIGSSTMATSSAGGLSASAPYLSAISGAIMGYQNSGVKGAAAGAAGGYLGVKGGAAAGSYFGPIGTAVGAVIGGILGSAGGSKLFGGDWVTKDTGLSLAVEDGDFLGKRYEYQKKKGGLFGKNKKRTRLSALDPQMQSALDATYDATEGSVLTLFDRLNVQLNDGVLDGLNVAATKISTKGKTGEEIQEAITKWFGGVADSMVSAVDLATKSGLGGYNFEALTTFVNNLYSVNAAVEKFGVKAVGFNVAGGKAVETLVAVSGGMEALTTGMNDYYAAFTTEMDRSADSLAAARAEFTKFGFTLPGTRDGLKDVVKGLDLTTEIGQNMFSAIVRNAKAAADAYTILEQRESAYRKAFFSEAENTALAIKNTTAELKALGVTLPASRSEYRKMVEEAAKSTTDTGKAMYDTLMNAAGAASTVFDELDRRLNQGVTDSFSGVQRSISAKQKAATAAYNATNTSLSDMSATAVKSVTDLSSVSNSLESALKSLRGTSDDAVKTLRAQAQATLQSALATARAGGSLASFTGLEDALDTVSDNNTDLYGSMEDFARDQGRTANVVAELNAINGKQLTAAEKLQKSLEDQIGVAKAAYDAQMAQFDQQLEFAQAQMDAFNGIDTSVKSVEAAIKALNGSLIASLAAKPATGAGSAMANTPQNNGSIIDTIYRSVLGRDTKGDEAGAAFWANALQTGTATYQDVAVSIAKGAVSNGGESAASKQSAKDYLRRTGVPGYAAGGDFGGGLRLVGENGPELEVTGPSRIFNANQTAAMIKGGGNDSATVAELRGLRAEMQSNFEYIGRHIKATAEHTGEMNESGIQVVGTVDTKAVAA